MKEMFKKKIKPPKKTLADFLQERSVVTGKEVVQKIKEKEKRQKEFEEAVEFERRNGRA
jgi:hypothetical protein